MGASSMSGNCSVRTLFRSQQDVDVRPCLLDLMLDADQAVVNRHAVCADADGHQEECKQADCEPHHEHLPWSALQKQM